MPWLRYAAIAIPAFAAILLWRSPLAASFRPPIAVGSSWQHFVIAWTPEAIALAITAFFSHRILARDSSPLSSRFASAALICVAIWLCAWGFGVLAPGYLMLGPLGETWRIARDTAVIGGVAGTFVAAGLLASHGIVYGLAAFAAMWIGAGILAWRIPGMIALARYGAQDVNRPAIDPARTLGVAALIGTSYWLWQFALSYYPPSPSITIADVGGTLFLIGLFAAMLEPRRPAAPAN